MTLSAARLWTGSLAVIFLIAHLAFLPTTLEDIDSLNFALGIHDFDPSKHQPHPPGYPVFIGLAKIARVLMPSDATALALLGAIFGALAVFPLWKMYEHLDQLDPRTRDCSPLIVSMAVGVAVTCPLYWFNAGRPMSDVAGLAVTLAAQTVLVSALVRQRVNPQRTPEALADTGSRIVLGAFLSAFAVGMRSQAMWLTLPLLALVLVQRAGRGAAGALLGSAIAFTTGVLLWAVPLVIASGGVMAYRAAITAQAAEDFSGVEMLYRNPSARRLAFALLETFIYPWASPVLGAAVFGLAALGALTLMLRARRLFFLLVVLIGPYVLMHLIVQETVTTRYALPLIPVIAYLAVKGIHSGVVLLRQRSVPARLRHGFGETSVTVAVGILVVWSLAVTLPSVRVYAREGSPTFAALAELRRFLLSEPTAVVGMHHTFLRSAQTENFGDVRVLRAPPMREWLELARYWGQGTTGPIWFLADPARTDIELVDPLSRRVQSHYVWRFPRERFISGVRPDVVDLVRIESPPGWYAEEGWHLTSETLNMSERLGRSEGVAYIRSRPEAAMLILGAEHVDVGSGSSRTATDSPLTLSATINDRAIGEWQLRPAGALFERMILKPGELSNGALFSRLVVSYAAPDGRPQPVRLTQFAVAPPEAVFAIQHAGWNEIEYSRQLQRRWRWTTSRATTYVHSGGREVTVTIVGESPLQYFDAAPRITVRAGNQVLSTTQPSEDFELVLNVPAATLAAADGMISIETDQTFVPHERSGSPDRRTLGLRIFRFDVR